MQSDIPRHAFRGKRSQVEPSRIAMAEPARVPSVGEKGACFRYRLEDCPTMAVGGVSGTNKEHVLIARNMRDNVSRRGGTDTGTSKDCSD